MWMHIKNVPECGIAPQLFSCEIDNLYLMVVMEYMKGELLLNILPNREEKEEEKEKLIGYCKEALEQLHRILL